MATLKYSPLRRDRHEIRLLTIHSRPLSERDEGPIQCSLKHFTLTEPNAAPSDPSSAPYNALSYTWGPIEPNHLILVNEQPFTIRQNLWEFLTAAEDTQTHPLWIDQICINQDDIPERNHQVSLMEHVYRKAHETTVWLGPARDGSNLVFDLINTTHLPRHSFVDLVTESAHGDFDAFCARYLPHGLEIVIKPSTAENANPNLVFEQLNHGLNDFMERPYWARIWIIQELFLSRRVRVHQGGKSALWTDLCGLLTGYCTRFKDTTPSRFDQLGVLVETYAKWQTRASAMAFHDVVDSFMQSNMRFYCFDARDQFFGFQGLLRREDRIEVDYGAPVAALYLTHMPKLARDYALEKEAQGRLDEVLRELEVYFELNGSSEAKLQAAAWKFMLNRWFKYFKMAMNVEAKEELQSYLYYEYLRMQDEGLITEQNHFAIQSSQTQGLESTDQIEVKT